MPTMLSTIPIDLSDYPRAPQRIPPLPDQRGDYRVDYIRTRADLEEVFRLRYRVFNLEMQEGLDSAHDFEMDFDEYDPCCHHVIVRHHPSQSIIGTYRLQTRHMAREQGFYARSEFDLSMLPESVLDDSVEVGRACIDQNHRNGRTLILLWRGVTRYLTFNRMRFLFGCCSINSQDPAEGLGVLEWLKVRGFMHPEFQVRPQPGFECKTQGQAWSPKNVKIPTLMKLYLENDLKVLGEPAIDRIFKTIDYFVILDAMRITEKTKNLLFDRPPE